MQSGLIEEQALRLASFNGIEFYYIMSEKFKTNSINIFFHDNLTNENATKNALLPAVLRRGCKKFPTLQEIALCLEEMYGASFDCGVSKKGEQQIIKFYIEYVSDKYVAGSYGTKTTSLFEKAFDLLYEIITEPAVENGTFRTDYVNQEKENLKKLIESRVNDKVQYSIERCFEEMCSDEPFSIYEYGTVDDLAAIDPKNLYDYYKTLLESLPIKVYICGNVESGRIQWLIKKFSELKRQNIKKLVPGSIIKEVKQTKNITERMNVNQGKLSLGFRTNVPPNDKDYYSLLVYNSILGGGIHSKLFQHVREKASLAYYVFSRIERFKGLMIIASGIETGNKDSAVEIILKQVDEIKKGNIYEEEFNAAVKAIETGVKSLKDSQLQMVDFYLSQAVAGTYDNLDLMIQKIKNVTKQDVINIAHKVKLDTVYFLMPDDQ